MVSLVNDWLPWKRLSKKVHLNNRYKANDICQVFSSPMRTRVIKVETFIKINNQTFKALSKSSSFNVTTVRWR